MEGYAYENRTIGGFFLEEVQTQLRFGENVLYAIFRLQYK